MTADLLLSPVRHPVQQQWNQDLLLHLSKENDPDYLSSAWLPEIHILKIIMQDYLSLEIQNHHD